jgi:hypothetical protein
MAKTLRTMFQSDTYESRFKDYLSNYSIDNTSQLEQLQRQFDQDHRHL